jgi:non-specific serine/threonine protein kinase
MPSDLQRRLAESFERGTGHGLLQLGAGEVGTSLPIALSYWRDFAARYVTALCTTPESAESTGKTLLAHSPAPPIEDLDALAAAAPPMTGAEYRMSRRCPLYRFNSTPRCRRVG